MLKKWYRQIGYIDCEDLFKQKKKILENANALDEHEVRCVSEWHIEDKLKGVNVVSLEFTAEHDWIDTYFKRKQDKDKEEGGYR